MDGCIKLGPYSVTNSVRYRSIALAPVLSVSGRGYRHVTSFLARPHNRRRSRVTQAPEFDTLRITLLMTNFREL